MEGFRAIPGAVYMLSESDPPRVIFFLGYEEAGLDRAMEDFQMLNPAHCSVAFGVPAFQPGWEIDAFPNNVKVMIDRGMRDGGVYFCGAENPSSAYRILETIQSEMTNDQRLFLVPIGTKPNGIAAALYAALNGKVGLLYDHPGKKKNRSRKVARWHLFQARSRRAELGLAIGLWFRNLRALAPTLARGKCHRGLGTIG
jgi:hypothetical protein